MESISNDKTKYLDIAPPDWDRTTIGEIFKFSSGKAKPQKTSKIRTKKFTFPIYGGNGILGYADKFIFDEPKLILGRVGEYCGCAHLTEKFSWISDNALYAKEINGKIDYNYFKFFFDYFDLNRFSNKNGQPLITQGNISSLAIAKPQFKIQNKISYILSTLKNAIEKQQRIIDTTQALKKSLLHQLFTQGTKGEKLKETEIGLMPESWEMIKINELGEIVTGTTPKTAISEYYTPAEYDFIAPFDIGKSCKVYNSQKKISAKGINVIRELPKYSVLCVCIGSTIGKVGLTTKEKSATNQQINSIICDESRTNPLFAYYLLTFYYRLWAEAATPSPVPILSKGSFSKLEIPYTVDLKEQNEISDTLYVLEAKVEFQQRKKAIYESLFKTLLNELMSGSVRVDELDFEVLS